MRVFISYRRDDSHYIADRIYDWLIRASGRRNIFKDVDSIPLGQDFRRVIHKAVGQCDVFLVVIGPGWLTAAKASGMRRLDDPLDFVRMEIEAAIERDTPIIPLLVNNATMPTAEDLPPSLQTLAYRNGLLVRPDPDFHNDMGRLIAVLSKTRFPWQSVLPPVNHGYSGLPRWFMLVGFGLLSLLLGWYFMSGQRIDEVKPATKTKPVVTETRHVPEPGPVVMTESRQAVSTVDVSVADPDRIRTDLYGIYTSITNMLVGIKDMTTTEEAVNKLIDMIPKIDNLHALRDKLSDADQRTVAKVITDRQAKLQDLNARVVYFYGRHSYRLKLVLDTIEDKLASFAIR